MNRKDQFINSDEKTFFDQLMTAYERLDDAFIKTHQRSLPFNETIIDRWERAKKLGFGEETSIYDSSLVFGNVTVGKNGWIGPFTIIDGSGGLSIGDYCTISVGTHIYTHDNVKQTLGSGKFPIEREPVSIGNNVYIGPNVIITKGISIGNYCVIAANSFINKNIPDNSIVMGQPGKVVGMVSIGDTITFNYNKRDES